MTYYEELGIRRDASVEEIRHAYKMMARLLHPDCQSDPHLRALADCQMKRLGDIVATLVNRQTRRQYDDNLEIVNRPRVPIKNWAVPAPERTVRRWEMGGVRNLPVLYWFWILIGVTVLGLATWDFVKRETNVQASAPHETAPQREPVPEQAQPPTGHRRQKAKARRTKSIAGGASRLPYKSRSNHTETAALDVQPRMGSLEPARTALPAPLSDVPLLKPSARETLKQANEVPGREPQRSAIQKESSFAGRWLSTADAAGAVDPGQYPASYVEFVLVEENGTLAGDYHARYKIPDRAVSPDVVFQARGAVAAKSGTLLWTSRAGGRGKAELTLRGPDVMHVAWWTTEFGKEQAKLGSGTAVLIRQKVP